MSDDSSDAVGPDSQDDLPPNRTANLAAVLHPPASADDPAGIEVAGAYVTVCVTPAGELQFSVELGDAAAWLRRADGTVSLRLIAEAETLFAAGVRPTGPPSDEDTGRAPGGVIPIAHGRRIPPSSL